jgi:aspartate aminotransferase
MYSLLSDRALNIEESKTLSIIGKAKQMAQDGFDIVNLSGGEPDFPTPDFVCKAAIKAINEGFTKYTANNGILELRKAICDKFKRDNGIDYTVDQVIVSNGGKHAIANILLSLINKDDEVIIPAPYWVSYPEMVKLADGKPVIINSDISTDFKINPKQLEEAITDKTKLIIFCSPSNPTGTVYSEEEIRDLFEIIKNKENIFILSDEIYEYLIYDSIKHFSIASVKEFYDRVITVNGVSKAYSMTGWRIGYAAGPKWIIDACSKIQSQTTSNPCSISQKASLSAIKGDQEVVFKMRDEFKKRRDFMYNELNNIKGLKVNKPQGAFYMLVSVEGLLNKGYGDSSEEIAKYLLEKYYLATVPGIAFGSENYLRLSYADSMINLQKAIERFNKAFS